MPQTSEPISPEEYAARQKGVPLAPQAPAEVADGDLKNLQTVGEINELSKAIFCSFAGKLGSRHWDWLPVAKASMDAAEVFLRAFNQRYEPQSQVPTDPLSNPPSQKASSS